MRLAEPPGLVAVAVVQEIGSDRNSVAEVPGAGHEHRRDTRPDHAVETPPAVAASAYQQEAEGRGDERGQERERHRPREQHQPCQRAGAHDPTSLAQLIRTDEHPHAAGQKGRGW